MPALFVGDDAMNFGVMMKKYAWAHGLLEDLDIERLKPFIEEETGKAAVITEKRTTKATEAFEKLRGMIGKRWKIEGYEDGAAKKKKRKPKK
jgi:hypothetical protein